MTHRHETTDMDPRYVLYFGLALVIAGVVIGVGMWWLLRWFESQQAGGDYRPTLVEAPQSPPPEPRLQIAPGTEYRAIREKEMEILNGYGWVDREKGTARIPIDRAMEILVQRGVK